MLLVGIGGLVRTGGHFALLPIQNHLPAGMDGLPCRPISTAHAAWLLPADAIREGGFVGVVWRGAGEMVACPMAYDCIIARCAEEYGLSS